MNLLGIHLTLLIGPNIALPAPEPLVSAIRSVEVTHTDEGRSGFQISFQVGRSGALDLVDYGLLRSPLLKAFSRVILIATFNATPRVLMDGIITHHELSPGREGDGGSLTITGEDVSIMMDREEKSVEHPAQDESAIAMKLIAGYVQYGLIPMVIPPSVIDVAPPTERIPVQQGTDRQYLEEIARRFAFVFYVTPGPAPFTNIAYWGPPIRTGVPQRALSVNLGSATNVNSISFRSNPLAPTLVSGKIQDRQTNKASPVQTFISTRPPLGLKPVLAENGPHIKKTRFRKCGLGAPQAQARAQAMTDSSVDSVTAEGELDSLRYGDLLAPRALAGLRGVGFSYDGFWYVKRVTHVIENQAYKQRFTLTREGTDSTTPVVVP